MKSLLSWKSLAVAIAVLILGAASANAQISTLRVNVPFAFTAGTNVLPAGEYEINVHTDLMLSRIVPLNGDAVSLVRLVPGVTDRSPAKSEKGMLRFEKFGQRYVLIGVWRPGCVAGNSVVGGRPAREYAQIGDF